MASRRRILSAAAWWRTSSLTAGARNDPVASGTLRVPGAMDGETMLFCVKELLVPTLKRGDIVVMENNPIPKLDESEDAIDARGASVLFLPTDAPDLHPIAPCWAKVNARVRSLTPR